jgi:hypothetical protein
VRTRPRWLRWLRRAGITLLTLAAVGGGRYAYRHHEVTTRLEEAVAELDRTDPGWRLHDIEGARAEIPDAENSARHVVAASRLLPKDWPPQQVHKAFEDLEPAERLDRDQYALLGDELKRVAPALAEALELARLPNGRHRITYLRNVLNTLLGDQDKTRLVTALLRYEALCCAEAGDMKGAMRACHAALNAARSLGDEPFAVSQLIRVACVAVACQAVERTLAQGEPGPADLADMQRALENEDAFDGLMVAMRGERALMHEMFDALESGDVLTSQVAGNDRTPPSWQEVYLRWIVRDNFRDEHPLYLSMMSRRLVEVRQPMHKQADAEQQFATDARSLPSSAILTRLLLPGMHRLGEAERRKHANVRCLAVALAAERYRKEHGDWPKTLDRLTPDLLTAVPLDPFDGKPLRYRRLADGAVVYSVGPDGADNGGTLDRPNAGLRPGTDVGYRLWDVKHRRQPYRERLPPPREE